MYNYTIFIHILSELLWNSSVFNLLNSGSKIMAKFYLIVPKQDDYISQKFINRATNELNKFVKNHLHLEHVNFLAFT